MGGKKKNPCSLVLKTTIRLTLAATSDEPGKACVLNRVVVSQDLTTT
ncbi:hypothetical protein Pint_20398 [Pistacia integerrima]|uniref:Uncharacterized protein n=1 Tax=Pistacia integerrima TaxID=434235 RepID=A0ACC0XBY3_9ROSI|nr:hypothetical protein Pint_20398 [Pistacia integerrima]